MVQFGSTAGGLVQTARKAMRASVATGFANRRTRSIGVWRWLAALPIVATTAFVFNSAAPAETSGPIVAPVEQAPTIRSIACARQSTATRRGPRSI